VYYFWTNPDSTYYLWDGLDEIWTPVETVPPGSTEQEIPILPNITYNLTKSADTVLPGGTIEVSLSITGPSEPTVVPYEILGTFALEDVKQVYEITFVPVPGVTPVEYYFSLNGGAPYNPLLTKGNSFTFSQSDPSNTGNTLLLSTYIDGTHIPGGAIYETGVFYYLDGVQVANSAAYIAGFDAATTRYFTITTSSLIPDYIYFFSYQNAGYNSPIALQPTTLNKFEGVFFGPSQQTSTLYITVEPAYVPTDPVPVTVQLSTFTDQVEEITFNIVPV
jgi:hypothetical protein